MNQCTGNMSCSKRRNCAKHMMDRKNVKTVKAEDCVIHKWKHYEPIKRNKDGR